jgi:hypothetical protein
MVNAAFRVLIDDLDPTGGYRGLFPTNGVAFTGEGKLVRRETGHEQKSRSVTIRHRVRRLREPSFQAPCDRISDPQIPLTRLFYKDGKTRLR